jgi:Protein kinase domain
LALEPPSPRKFKSQAPGHLPPGTVVGGYTIEEVIGRGGMGTVYLAQRPRLGNKVALKLLNPELAADERFRDRFVRESRMASAIEHPNIIPVYDAGEVGNLAYIAMRYVEGPNLKQLLHDNGPLDLRRALALVAQIASALDAAHVRGLVHRDVKPANVLVAQGGASEFAEHVYLTDFGVSKRIGSNSGITGTRQFIGTLGYAAPEQIQGQEVDARADVYSLGCVFYELLTGSRPFNQEEDMALGWAHVYEPPPRVTDGRVDLPPLFDSVIARALAKAPNNRYRTCSELVSAARASNEEATVVDGDPLGSTRAGATIASPTIAAGAPEPTRSTIEGERTLASGLHRHDWAAPAMRPVGPTTQQRRSSRRRTLLLGLAIVAAAGIAAGVAVPLLAFGSSRHAQSTTVGSPTTRTTTRTTHPSGPKPQLVDVRAVGRPPVATMQFALRATLANGQSNDAVQCLASLAGRSLPGKGELLHARRAICRWQLPTTAAGMPLWARILVGSAKSDPYSATVKTLPMVQIAPSSVPLATAGQTYAVAFSIRIHDPSHVLARRPAQRQTCQVSVAASAPQKITVQASSDATTVTCNWPIPSAAAGKVARIVVTVHAAGLSPMARAVRVPIIAAQPPTSPPPPIAPPPVAPPPPPPTDTSPIPH